MAEKKTHQKSESTKQVTKIKQKFQIKTLNQSIMTINKRQK